MRHLDHDAMVELKAGAPQTRAYFAAHLAQSCEACEAFLSAHDHGLLDGVADSLLVGGAQPQAPEDERGFQQLRDAQRARVPAARRPTRRRWVAIAGSLAAGVIAIAGAWRLTSTTPTRAPDEGIKSIAPALTLELEAARRSEGGALTRVEPGASIPADGELVLRAYATEKGGAWLLRQTADGRLEPLGSFDLHPGWHALTLASGEVAALPLHQEAGVLTLWLIGAAGTTPALDDATRAAQDSPAARLATARLTITVTPRR